MSDLLLLTVVGLSVGGAYALLALSINIVFSAARIVNFAQGQFMMLGGMLAATFYVGLRLPFTLAVLVVGATLALLGIATDLLIVRPLRQRRAPPIAMIVATVGLDLMLPISAALIWGRVERPIPSPLGSTPIPLLGTQILPHNFLIIGMVAVSLLVTWYFFSRTLFGRAMRAAAMTVDGARLVGINVPLVVTVAFAASAALAGIAGVLLAPLSYAGPWLGLGFAVKGFTAAIVGGLGSLPGGVIGGFLVGLFDALIITAVGRKWGDGLTLALMILILYVRPRGLLGVTKVREHSEA